MTFKQIRNTLVAVSSAHYYSLLQRELRNMTSVLDVGCGSSSPLSKVEKTFYSEGLDIFSPDLKKIKKAKVHDTYVVGNVLDIDRIYKGKKFDAVIALDVIEHLPKEKGWELMKKMEKLARKKVIIVTPNGFVPQKANDNPYQEHVSGWEVKEFQSRGYKLYGMRGLKYLLGEHASLKYKPWIFWGVVSFLSQFIVYYIPQLSFEPMAVKEMKK